MQVAERPLKKMVIIFVSYCVKLDWNDNYAQVGLDSLQVCVMEWEGGLNKLYPNDRGGWIFMVISKRKFGNLLQAK